MSRKIFTLVIRNRIAVCAFLLLVTSVCGWFAAQVKFDNTIESYFLESDLQRYNRFLEQFGSDEIIVVAFGGGELFTNESLRLIDSLSGEIKKLPHVRRVLSLTTARIVYNKGGDVYFERIVPSLPLSAAQLATVKRRALDDPIVPGTLLSRDAKRTAIVAEIDHIIGEFDYKVELLRRIRAILEREQSRSGRHFHLGGTSVLDDAVFRYTRKDQGRFMPLVVGISVFTMLAMFGRLRWILPPLVVVVLSAIWAYGFMAILGYKVNIISTILGPLLLAVAIADSMHFIADYLQEGEACQTSKVERLRRSFEKLLRPCFMTSLTTVLGLLSLLGADLVPLRQFGLVAAVGVASAFLITILALPVMLYLMPLPAKQRRTTEALLSRLLDWLGNWGRGRATVVLVSTGLAAVPALVLLLRLQVGTNSLDYFKLHDPVRIETEWIDKNIGGSTSIEFFIDTGKRDGLKSPALLERIEAFQAYLEGIDGITGVYSVVDLVKSLNRAFNDGDPRALAIPRTARSVAQQLLVIEGSKDFSAFLSEDYSRGRITARVELDKSQALARRMPEIERRMRRYLGAGTATATGLVYLMNRMEHYLLSSQIKSFLLAFALVSAAIMLMLRSFKIGLLAMIPNIMPILFTLSLMPLFGIALDIGTVMIAGVALGLVVDDTIHFLDRVRHELKDARDVRAAIAKSMQVTGRPIIFTSVVLSLAFSVLIFASFNPVTHFGVLCSSVILLALLFDLLVLPAVLGFVRL